MWLLIIVRSVIPVSCVRFLRQYNFYANRFSGLGGVVTHTYIYTYGRNLVNAALSIRVTLNTNPAMQVLTRVCRSHVS